MNKKYTRFSFEERIQLEKLLSHNQSYSKIASALNRNKSTIAREVKRTKIYSAVSANWDMVYKASDRRRFKSKMNLNPALKSYVLSRLKKKWSPDQISVSLKMNYPDDNSMQLSRESIYFYVYVHCKKSLKEELTKELRQQRKFRGNTRRGADKRTTITEAIRIDERPVEALGRDIPGHWEGDLILGKDRESAIGTLVERSTRSLILVHLKARDSKTVRIAFEKNSRPSLFSASRCVLSATRTFC